MITQLQMRKLRKIVIRQIRQERKVNLYYLHLEWARIRKQKDRRRRKTIKKLWVQRQTALMKRQQLFVCQIRIGAYKIKIKINFISHINLYFWHKKF